MDAHDVNLKRVFISHASKDRLFGDAIVRLLSGIGLAKNQIIYTSDSDYGIPPGHDIFDYLKDQISDGTYMIYLLSGNYYNSIVCLNEMGAAWVRQADEQMLLLPGFDTNDPRFQSGVSNPNKMAVRVDDAIQVWKIVEDIVMQFHLNPLNVNIQDIYKNYLQEVEILKQTPAIQFAIDLAETERALRVEPQETSLYLSKGRYLYDIDSRNYPESVQSLLYAMYLDPLYSEAYYRLIQVAGSHRDNQHSLAVAEEAMRRFPEEAYAYGCHAYALKNLGRDNEAIKDLSEAIQRGPNMWFYYMRGTSYQAVGDMENALADLWTVYDQYDSAYVDTVEHITEICKKIGAANLLTKADTLKEQALESLRNNKPEDAPAFFEEARKYYDCILLAEPINKDALRERGGLCYNRSQFDQALKYWTELLKLSQTSYHYYLCALANKDLGNGGEMRRLAALGLGCPDDGWHEKLKAML